MRAWYAGNSVPLWWQRVKKTSRGLHVTPATRDSHQMSSSKNNAQYVFVLISEELREKKSLVSEQDSLTHTHTQKEIS